VDSLHLKSGFPPNKLVELHGNAFMERCDTCGTEYTRDFDVTSKKVYFPDEQSTSSSHWTGRMCEKAGCVGKLMDSIVNFGEFIPQKQFEPASREAWSCDFALVLGTSLRVGPSNKLPLYSCKKNGGKLVIVNLQLTPFTENAFINIHASTDDVLYLLLKELELEIPLVTPSGSKITAQNIDIDAKYTKLKHLPPTKVPKTAPSPDSLLASIKGFQLGGLKKISK